MNVHIIIIVWFVCILFVCILYTFKCMIQNIYIYIVCFMNNSNVKVSVLLVYLENIKLNLKNDLLHFI